MTKKLSLFRNNPFSKLSGSIATLISADITPEMLKLCRVTKVKVFFLVLVYIFNCNLFEFSAAILEKGLFGINLHL